MAPEKSRSARHKGARYAKPVLVVFVAIAALVFVASLALPLLVSTDAAKDRLEEAVSSWLGARVAIDGASELSLLPDLRLTLTNVRLEGRDGQWSMDSPHLSASLDPASIIGGDFAPEHFSIVNPDIRLFTPAGEESGSEPPFQRAKRELARLFSRQLSIRGGTITLGEAASTPQIMALNATLNTDDDGKNARLSGRFDYAGERIDLNLLVSDTRALSGNEPGTLALKAVSPSFEIDLNGRIMGRNADRIDGSLSVSSGEIARLFGGEAASDGENPAPIKTVRLSGEGIFSLDALDFDQATLDIDGNIADGRLSLRAFSDRPSAEGTLAFDSLDLSAFEPTISNLLEDSRQANRPLSSLLGAFDLDLRLSAANVTTQRAVLNRSALALLLKEGDLTIDVSEAGIAGGAGRAHLRLSPTSVSRDLYALEASAELMNATPVVNFDIPLLPRGGRASLSIQARSKGETAALLRRKLTASLRFEFTGNGVEAFDLDNKIGSLAEPTVADAPLSGSTPLTRFEISGRKNGETLEIDAIDAETGQYSVSAHGTIRLSDGALSLKGIARPLPLEPATESAGSAATPASTPKTTFKVHGTIAEPAFLPD
ncbi:hypothetical protein HPQ64_19725 [Rhizobiales bacterium]|uniref:AsmA family protein n=1 Tax=Hongsoonwoonella zoysiae TaxID=2821844 RepID=UPI0015613973|nr:hypothetical protein [Hongsoonwoonella zoysiae]NRG19929.1 hypothetical protein [Hongsoonwoonella zoysiae]